MHQVVIAIAMRASIVLNCLALCVLYSNTLKVESAKILSVFAFPGPSQYIFAKGLLTALAERGHDVTSITVFPQKKTIKNLREIGIIENLDLIKSMLGNVDKMNSRGVIAQLNMIYDIGAKACEQTLENAAVKQLLKNKTFDLVIVETFVSEALYGLAQHFDAPIIGISTFGTISWMDSLVGNTSPASYIPHPFETLSTKMTFGERLFNLAMNVFEHIHYHSYHIPTQRAIFEKYFPDAKITFDAVLKNFSLMLLNQHFTLSFPRPYVPNMIEVGGLHVKQKPDPLPADMQEFLDNAKDGAVYFSLGSNLKAKDLPLEKRQIFLNTFAALKQRVLWKFEDPDAMPNKPANVYINKWFPQSSVLAHPNVKVFISHGGWLSTTESVFHAKPILGMPMFGDQPSNVAKAVRQGIALSVEFRKLNEVEFKQKLHELLHNTSYTRTVQQLSKRFRDQPMTPLDTAVYWTEYVLRHEGGTHLRNAGQDLNFWQYHSLDTIFTLFGGLLLAVVGVLWVELKLFSWICGKKQHQKVKAKLKKK